MYSCSSRLALAGLLLAASTAGQSIAPFGAGCGKRNPLLGVHGSPSPGGVIEIHLTRAAPFAPHLVVVGLSDRKWAGGPLPFDLPASLGFATGCRLLVSPDASTELSADANGVADLRIPIPNSATSGRLFVQALGLPAGEAWYATGGVRIDFGPARQAAVTGRVTRRAGGSPVAGARVTLFTPGLAVFHETRTGPNGNYAFAAIPAGAYRLGVAAPGFDYEEVALAVGRNGAVRAFLLDPESHPGEWTIAGNTWPLFLDATDNAWLLPDGRIFYDHDTTDPLIFHPVTGVKIRPRGSGRNQGCTHGTLLEDGSVIEIGGADAHQPGRFRNALRWTTRWSPTLGWQRLADMLLPSGRWYPGLARLADGSVMILGGSVSRTFQDTNTCEIYDPNTNRWRWTGSLSKPVFYPPAALLHDGRVLCTFPEPQTWDPKTGRWTLTGPFVSPKRGWPDQCDHSIVVLHDGRVLAIGITDKAGPGASMVELFDPRTNRWTARSSPDLTRKQAEVCPLPDGRILVAGGDVENRRTSEPQLWGVVKRCDLYDPATDRWRRIGNFRHFKEYHAVTLLVPDGRVLTTGGTMIKFRTKPSSPDIEGYLPPYLFRGVRPRISNLSARVLTRGATVAFDVFPATRITRVVLMGTGVHTHWVEGGVRRRLELSVRQTGSRVSCTLPKDPNVLPVGHYMLFAMVDDIPSVAVIVRVRG